MESFKSLDIIPLNRSKYFHTTIPHNAVCNYFLTAFNWKLGGFHTPDWRKHVACSSNKDTCLQHFGSHTLNNPHLFSQASLNGRKMASVPKCFFDPGRPSRTLQWPYQRKEQTEQVNSARGLRSSQPLGMPAVHPLQDGVTLWLHTSFLS